MSQLNTGNSWSTGDTVTAAKLNDQVNDSTIRAEVVSDQSTNSYPASTDQFLTVTGGGVLYKIALSSIGSVAAFNASKLQGATVASSSPTADYVLTYNGTTSEWEAAVLSVATTNITDANVTTAKIADANITTAKIADANVTTAKIADAAVTAGKLADTAVTAGSYTSADVTVDAQGRVTAASDGEDTTIGFASAQGVMESSPSGDPALFGTCTLTLPAGKTWKWVKVVYSMNADSSSTAVTTVTAIKDSSDTAFSFVNVSVGVTTDNNSHKNSGTSIFEGSPAGHTTDTSLVLKIYGDEGDISSQEAYAVGQYA